MVPSLNMASKAATQGGPSSTSCSRERGPARVARCGSQPFVVGGEGADVRCGTAHFLLRDREPAGARGVVPRGDRHAGGGWPLREPGAERVRAVTTMLVPLDGSPGAERALPHALRIAEASGA